METKIKVGTKVHYNSGEGLELNLIAVHETSTELFKCWLCVDPKHEMEKGRCSMHNCFEDDLEIGWK